jgi:hypothetical protein
MIIIDEVHMSTAAFARPAGQLFGVVSHMHRIDTAYARW